MRHALVRLADEIDWDRIDAELVELFSDKGRPGTETRFMVGLLLLKHSYAFSDEAAIAAIDRNRMSGSSFDGRKPRRRQKSAGSASTAWAIRARPPINCAAATAR